MIFEIIEQVLLYFVLLVAYAIVLFGFAIFAYAMWVALTQGDDVIARFGRKVLRRKQ